MLQAPHHVHADSVTGLAVLKVYFCINIFRLVGMPRQNGKS